MKRQYWQRLLSIPQLRAPIDAVLAAQFDNDARPAEGNGDEALLDALLDADPSCALADRIAADVHALATGGDATCLAHTLGLSRTSLQRQSDGLLSCRHAWTAARKEFIAGNLGLVVSLARRYQASGHLALDDIIQDGNLGLMTAVDRFDPRRGFRFSTYAVWWIRHAIGRALSNTGRIVRLPTHVIELQMKVAKARRAFEQTHHRVPDAAELAAETGVGVEQVLRLGYVLRERATAFPTDDDISSRRLDVLLAGSPETATLLDRQLLEDRLDAVLCELDTTERDILTKRFGLDGNEGLTLREVGARYSRSRERIRQLQEGALAKVRRALERGGFGCGDLADEVGA